MSRHSMHPALGILAGLLVGEVAHKVATHLDSSDDELKQILDKDSVSEEDLKRAIQIASDDPTTVGLLQISLAGRSILIDINQTI